MSNIKILMLMIENFKGIEKMKIDFENRMKLEVRGANATGKTTVFDAVTWLLFDRDSLGSSKFEIRRLDVGGEKIHNEEISVTAVMEIDGKEVALKKSQTENWVKKRGSSVAELQGNKNSFEIDGFPKSAKDFKAYIDSLISDEKFQMLTNPMFFPAMDWKKQRQILMDMLPDLDDAQMARENGFGVIVDDLEKTSNLDDITKKYRKAFSEWKKKQEELPIRIDELSRQIVPVDEKGIRLLETSIEGETEKLAGFIAERESLEERNTKLHNEIMQLKFKLTDIEKSANSDHMKQRSEIRAELDAKTSERNELDKKVMNLTYLIKNEENAVNSATERGAYCNEEYKRAKSEIFDENHHTYRDTCPTCGQKLPESEIEKARNNFDKHKKEHLEHITKEARRLKAEKDEAVQKIEKYKSELEEAQKKVTEFKTELDALNAKLDVVPVSADMTNNSAYKAVEAQISDYMAEINRNVYDGTKESETRRELDRMKASLADIRSAAESNKRIESRIEELREEQLDVAQATADAEKMLFNLESYIKFKMEKVSGMVNQMFDGLTWKLFENQINGGMRETCSLEVNGVPYSSLNNGHRIVAGLQIIKTLQKVFNVSVPVFVDNAEAISTGNFPEMDCQVVKLIVTDDERLVFA